MLKSGTIILYMYMQWVYNNVVVQPFVVLHKRHELPWPPSQLLMAGLWSYWVGDATIYQDGIVAYIILQQ